MELKVDLSKKPTELTTLEFLLLAFHDYLTEQDYSLSDESLAKLLEGDYIKVTDSSEGLFDLRAKSLKFKAKEVGVEEVVEKPKRAGIQIDWIDEYRKLFKAKTSAIGIMGSRTLCLTKMKKFMVLSKVDKGLIMAATRYYLATINDIRYIQRADYFINKDGGSRLESFIEEYQERGSTTTFYEEV